MDTQLLPYRLKSARRKKRLQKEDRDKQLLKLRRERDRISNDPGLVTTVLLDEPYQRGWKRLFVLRPEVQKSAQAEFYQQILNRINTVQYHYDKSFKVSRRNKYRHRYHYPLPQLQAIREYDWHLNKAKLTDAQRDCFNKVTYWDDTYYRWAYKYEFASPHLFKIVVKPHIITTVRLRDVLMEGRMKFIDDYLEKSGLNYRLTKLEGGYYRYWKWTGIEKGKYANPLKHKQLHDIVMEYRDENYF